MVVVSRDDPLDRADQANAATVSDVVSELVTQQVRAIRRARAIFVTFATFVASRVDRRRASAVVDRGVSLFPSFPFLSLPFPVCMHVHACALHVIECETVTCEVINECLTLDGASGVARTAKGPEVRRGMRAADRSREDMIDRQILSGRASAALVSITREDRFTQSRCDVFAAILVGAVFVIICMCMHVRCCACVVTGCWQRRFRLALIDRLMLQERRNEPVGLAVYHILPNESGRRQRVKHA
ncbi:hypothetical protein WT09_30785 [Burkholderia stagnalis]|nr:hypothetical protein WT09_30785 [Burkholderia stagnalis]